MTSLSILIFTAVVDETRAIARAMNLQPRPGQYKRDGAEYVDDPANPRLILRTIGIRAHRLPQPASAAGALCVIMAGFAGGLDPKLKTGDILIDGGPEAIQEIATAKGSLHCAREVVATPAEKSALFASTGACAVEMENNRVREWAKEAGIPFVGVRVILDAADQTIPTEVLNCTDSLGRPKVFRLIWGLMWHPGLGRELLRLRRNARLAGDRLGQAVVSVIETLRLSS